MRVLFPLFILLPIIEIYVLLKVGGQIGPLPTIAIILVTAVVGYQLFRAQGLEKLQKMRSSLHGSEQSQNLAMDMAEGVAILVAGILLLTPGFVTDAFGFACLIPPIRQFMIKRVMKRAIIRAGSSFHYQAHHHSQNSPHEATSSSPKSNVLEGEYREKK
ncbi:MAG: FxsA family protein [Arenicella sp.]